MTYKEVVENLKKDPPGSYWIKLHRKLGVYITYLIVNLLPNITANMITVSMLFFNILSGAVLAYGTLNKSTASIVVAFVIFSFSLTLDCVDGNIARIYKQTSYLGVYLDRIVHNVSHPIILLLWGFSIAKSLNSVLVMLLFGLASIVSEFSPLEIARLQVKISFVNQLVHKRTSNFELNKHNTDMVSYNTYESIEIKSSYKEVVRNILKLILSFETIFILTIIDLATNDQFVFSLSYCIIFFLAHFFKGFLDNDLKLFLDRLSQL